MQGAQTTEIGSLDQRVLLQARSDAPDALSGGTTETYTPIAAVWANVTAVSGSLYFASQQVEQTSTHAVTIRGRSDWQSVEYIQWGTRALRVQRVRDLDSYRPVRFQEFLCEEIETV